jgi:lipoprotein-anchoring transpeptidase ErfK/SrfK
MTLTDQTTKTVASLACLRVCRENPTKGPSAMTIRQIFRSSLAGLAAVCAVSLAPVSAAAQAILFDWGSNEKVNDSGRELVSFNSKARVGELIVSFGDRRVYLITAPGQALSYPIAIPREKSKWEGVTSVSQKRVNPSWTPTPEMIVENPRLPPWVPGGHPMNPLGTHALYLGSSSYRIHGTDAPWTIGTAASKGCVRMYNKDVQDLYPRVPVGTRVTVTYQTFKFSPMDGDNAKGVLATLDKGRKARSNDDVAETAAQNAKLWKEDGSDDGTVPRRASTSRASEDDQDNADNSADEDKYKKSYGVAVKSRDSDTEKYNDEKKYNYEKKQSADTDDADDSGVSKKRRRSQSDVETGSVDDAKKKFSSDESSEDREYPEKKPKLVAKEKSDDGDSPRSKKSSSDEDSASVAKRALAAAERAAAAAERAADAAERASAAVAKVTALEKKSDGGSDSSSSKPTEEPKAKEAAPLEAWPVVR